VTIKESDFRTDDGVVRIIRRKTLGLQVCIPAGMSDEEVKRRTNAMYPCGTENGWIIDQGLGRVICSEHSDREHIILEA